MAQGDAIADRRDGRSQETRKVFDASGNDVTTQVRPLSDAPPPPSSVDRRETRRQQQERLRGPMRLAMRTPGGADIPALEREMQAAGLDIAVERDAAAREIERDALSRSRTLDMLPVDASDSLTTAEALLQAFDAEYHRQASNPAAASEPSPAAVA